MAETPCDTRGGQCDYRNAEQRMGVDDSVLPILRESVDREAEAERDYDQRGRRPMQRDRR